MRIVEGESNAVAAHAGDGPVLLVVAHKSTVQGVEAAVLVLWDVRSLAIDGECAVLDSIGVSPDDWAEVGVVRLGVDEVLMRVVVSDHNILPGSLAILDVQVCQTSAVWNEGCLDPIGFKIVRLERVAREGWVRRA